MLQSLDKRCLYHDAGESSALAGSSNKGCILSYFLRGMMTLICCTKRLSVHYLASATRPDIVLPFLI